MAVRVEIKRLFLKGIYRSALANSQTLAEALDAAQDARFTEVENGSIIASTSGSGYSVSFTIPSGVGFSPVDVAMALSELDDLYDCAVTKLPSGTDLERYQYMLGLLKKVKAYTHNFRDVRL